MILTKSVCCNAALVEDSHGLAEVPLSLLKVEAVVDCCKFRKCRSQQRQCPSRSLEDMQMLFSPAFVRAVKAAAGETPPVKNEIS